MPIHVCLAGATGWAGSALARAIATTDDIVLTAAVARRAAGQRLGAVLGEPRLDCLVYATAAEALAQPCDVFFEYTKPDMAKANVLAALDRGCHVVIGTSGLSDDDYAEIATAAQAAGRGVLAVGNFALTAVLLQKFAEVAARYIAQWEIIDYARDTKPDAPSGTARELAARLGRIRAAELTVPLEATKGVPATRGARLNGMQVHSVRLPGYTIALEVVFGMPDQRLTIRHDAGASAEPYVAGALLAIRRVSGLVGLHRGLDSVLELE
ncbi:4-hydroxy-tetrahydrodipicolinate reductase [Chloroflexus islandicus]|uniref:4-hydroxy-tetrahydrodipicolinate reductase n=1 Tax=Chloroflexus islandicus TaxID=1707952 RepID=A0A178MDP7_9CHLR|nr:4-hydroxy-tetrahydrodipicolinate reductase [Chloroflexus islandicus]OAN45984.1 4-hydroxy-tetrahydrodipicolinate reductase [Chloroflexus islandicus]